MNKLVSNSVIDGLRMKVFRFKGHHMMNKTDNKLVNDFIDLNLDQAKRMLDARHISEDDKVCHLHQLIAIIGWAFKMKNFSFEDILLMGGSAYGLWYFQELHHHIDNDKGYWRLLKGAYQYKGHNLQCNIELLKQFFNSSRNYRTELMTNSERRYLKNLSEEITIYRGMQAKENDSEEFGISWTLKKSVAEQFAWRQKEWFKIPSLVHEMVVQKSEVVAYFNERKEFEIIYCGACKSQAA